MCVFLPKFAFLCEGKYLITIRVNINEFSKNLVITKLNYIQ